MPNSTILDIPQPEQEQMPSQLRTARYGYFAFSYLLHSVKYRLMAAMSLSVAYLFLVDLAHLDPVFRVAAFLFLGVIALVISLFYTRSRRL